MKPYIAIVAARFRQLFQYRATALAGVVTQFFWGIMHVMVFRAFYAGVEDASALPMTLDQAITYTWLVQAFLVFLPWNIDRDVEQLVRTGNIAYELVRPIDLYGLLFSRALAWRVGPGMLRIIPIVILAFTFTGFQLPTTAWALMLFVLSLCAALVLSTAMTTLMMIATFWTISSAGVQKFMTGLVVAFSGMQVPLAYYPDWCQPFLNAMPFRGLMDTPFRIYLGSTPLDRTWGLILHQLLWAVAIVWVGRWLVQRAQRNLVIQGG